MAVFFTNWLIVIAIVIGLPLALQLIVEICCVVSVFLDKKIHPHRRMVVISDGLNKMRWLGIYGLYLFVSFMVNTISAFKAPYHFTTEQIVGMVSVSTLFFLINYVVLLMSHSEWLKKYKVRRAANRILKQHFKDMWRNY